MKILIVCLIVSVIFNIWLWIRGILNLNPRENECQVGCEHNRSGVCTLCIMNSNQGRK